MLEFSEWLYCHQFPVQDALDQLQVAADILSAAATGGMQRGKYTICKHIIIAIAVLYCIVHSYVRIRIILLQMVLITVHSYIAK